MEILSLDPTYRFPFPHQITASTPTLSRRAPSMSRCPLKSSELPPNFPQILQITPNFPQNYQNYHITPKMLYEQGLFCDKRLYLCCGFQAGSPKVSHHFCSVMLRLSPVCQMLFALVVHTPGLNYHICNCHNHYHVGDQNYGRDLSSHLPFGSYAEQGMHTKAPSRFFITFTVINTLVSLSLLSTSRGEM